MSDYHEGLEEGIKIGKEEAAVRIAELEAALRFYADDENWRHNGQLDPNSGNFTGGPARAALEGGKKDE